MKAIAKTRPEPGLEIIEAPDPQIRPGCVKLRVLTGSICGTDRHIYNWDAWAAGRMKPPTIIGHEFCGEIIEVGEGVDQRTVGQIVASESHIVSLDSPWYLRGDGHIDPETTLLGIDTDGGFAPYAVIPWQNARPVPDGFPVNQASMMDALGNGVHTVMDGPIEGRKVLITGLGPIGLFAVAICKALGASLIVATEVSPYRIDLGKQLGADVVLNPHDLNVYDAIEQLVPDGFDATLEMSGHPGSFDLAVNATRAGGRISLLGVYADKLRFVDMNSIVFKGLAVRGIIGRKLWETWDQMTMLIAEKGLDVSPIVTHEMPFTDYEKAFETLESGEAGKIVLRFD